MTAIEIIENILLAKKGFRETIMNDKPISETAQTHLIKVNIEIQLIIKILKEIKEQENETKN